MSLIQVNFFEFSFIYSFIGEDELVSQMNYLKRFEFLSKKFDLTEKSADVYEPTFKVLKGENSELLAPAAIGVLYNLILWHMKAIDPAAPDMRAVSSLAKKRDAFIDQLQKVLESNNEENKYKVRSSNVHTTHVHRHF